MRCIVLYHDRAVHKRLGCCGKRCDIRSLFKQEVFRAAQRTKSPNHLFTDESDNNAFLEKDRIVLINVYGFHLERERRTEKPCSGRLGVSQPCHPPCVSNFQVKVQCHRIFPRGFRDVWVSDMKAGQCTTAAKHVNLRGGARSGPTIAVHLTVGI